ncbi:MAG: HDOD domain-containing protein, partial [Proteobacteria bacterium]|nr:HDOD domain-containing protein [Pseudomonadota bacterium]
FSKKALSIISVEKIHDHCVKTGVIAKDIATLEKMDKKKADNAMIASILHDLGKLLMAQYFYDDYKKVMEMVLQKGVPVFKAERQIFGVTHAEVGAYLLGLWGLPDNIIEGIAFHHNPSNFVLKGFGLCGLVHVAELMEHHEQRQPGTWDTLNGLDTEYMDKLELTDRIPLWREYIQKK